MSDTPAHKRDITGRERLAGNLAARWLGQVVVIISGFIMPRLIDDSLGSAALGIWDLGWTTVSYFRMLGLGLAGGLNRFVALYSAREAQGELRRAVSSTVFLQVIVAAVTLALALVLAWLLPALFNTIPADQVRPSQLLIAFLGANLAVRMLGWPARGILTGYHYWAITSAVTGVGDIIVLAGLYLALKMGGGLGELGMVMFGCAILSEGTRTIMAKRVYRERLLIWSAVDRKMIRKMFVYGMKNNVAGLPLILAHQVTIFMLVAQAGPAALAVFARPMALFSEVMRLIKHYAFLLTPMAGSIQGLARDGELKEFFLTSLRSSLAMTLPPVLLLSGYGDTIIRVWMGDDYVVPALLPLLGLGVLLPLANSAAMRILAGIDAHGRVALQSLLVTSIAFVVAAVPGYLLGWSVLTAACVIGIARTAGPGITVLVGACRRLSVPSSEYFREVVLLPLACNMPLAAVIACSRIVDPDLVLAEAVAWGSAGSALTAVLYWRFLLSAGLKARFSRRFLGRFQEIEATSGPEH